MPKKSNIHFDISERKVLLRIIDLVSVLAVLHLIAKVFDFDYFKINTVHWVWSIVLAFYLTIFATIFEIYNLQKASKFEVVIKNIILTSSLTVLFYLLTPYFTPELPENRLQIVYFYVAINLALFIWRYAYIVLISAPRFYKRVLLIGNDNDIAVIVDSLQKNNPNYRVVAFVSSTPKATHKFLSPHIRSIEQIDMGASISEMAISEVVVATPQAEGMTVFFYNTLIGLLENGVPIREYTQVYEEISQRVPVPYVDKDFYRYFPFSRSNQNKLHLFFHNVLDVFFSILGIAFGLVILPFIIFGNVLGNKGPLFYIQTRIGKNGKHFNIYKLRSMVTDAEKGGPQFAQLGDSRITTFGRFLRKSRFDEIPQFINVIKGEMSVIGPRPERPVFVASLSESIPFYEVRHIVKPGVTGWAQVNTSYGVTQDDALQKLQYDLYYIKHRSIFLDISIVMKTLSTIIFFRGQ